MKNGIVIWMSVTMTAFVPYSVMASDVGLSHTFVAGTPAKADKVNQNFTDIKVAVDDNNSRITANEASVAANETGISNNATSIDALATSVSANTNAVDTNAQSIANISQAVSIYDRDGNRLGRFISVAPLIDVSYSKQVHQGKIVWLLSEQGYLFALQRDYGLSIAKLLGIEYFQAPSTSTDDVISKARLYYESNNCTGQAYLSDANLDAIAYTGFSPVLSVRGGLVFLVTDMSGTETAFYLPKKSSAVPIAYSSSRVWNSTICNQNAPALLEFSRAVLSNEPAVTGVKSDPAYAWPLTID